MIISGFYVFHALSKAAVLKATAACSIFSFIWERYWIWTEMTKTFTLSQIKNCKRVESADLASHTIGPPLPIQRCRCLYPYTKAHQWRDVEERHFAEKLVVQASLLSSTGPSTDPCFCSFHHLRLFRKRNNVQFSFFMHYTPYNNLLWLYWYLFDSTGSLRVKLLHHACWPLHWYERWIHQWRKFFPGIQNQCSIHDE